MSIIKKTSTASTLASASSKSSSSSASSLKSARSKKAKAVATQSKTIQPTRTRTPLGIILLKRGMVKKFQLDFIVKLQKAYRAVDRKEPLGELLIMHRALSPLHLNEALLIQDTLPGESVTKVLSQLDEFSQKLTRFFQAKRMLEPK